MRKLRSTSSSKKALREGGYSYGQGSWPGCWLSQRSAAKREPNEVAASLSPPRLLGACALEMSAAAMRRLPVAVSAIAHHISRRVVDNGQLN